MGSALELIETGEVRKRLTACRRAKFDPEPSPCCRCEGANRSATELSSEMKAATHDQANMGRGTGMGTLLCSKESRVSAERRPRDRRRYSHADLTSFDLPLKLASRRARLGEDSSTVSVWFVERRRGWKGQTRGSTICGEFGDVRQECQEKRLLTFVRVDDLDGIVQVLRLDDSEDGAEDLLPCERKPKRSAPSSLLSPPHEAITHW